MINIVHCQLKRNIIVQKIFVKLTNANDKAPIKHNRSTAVILVCVHSRKNTIMFERVAILIEEYVQATNTNILVRTKSIAYYPLIRDLR